MNKISKKSQFYMFAAILFIASVFLIVSSKSTITLNKVDIYKDYLDNYLYEAKIVMNNALLNNEDVSDNLENMTKAFIDYTDNKDLNIGIAAFFSKDNKIYIVNYLKDSLLINNTLINAEQKEEIEYTQSLEVEYQNQTYYFYFSGPNEIQLKALFAKEK